MAFASSLLPVPPYRVCATPASEVAAFSPAKKSVSLAAARQRRGSRHGVRAEVNESGSVLAVDALSQVKHVLLPVLDRNPYLSEGTRQVRLYLENP
ncbi:universal stress family protein [Zea mays]|uniref:Universal stress family protein n=1 Tax=Zea mays TaxID=4577 RepID=A0A1D6IPQ3_MAIZE|nr:universal stress family protein [Zea mays]